MNTLDDKIKKSISLIQQGERLALLLNPKDGYFVGFSGGKDSQVLLDLVKLAGVKYKAYYSVTTNDPPENVYFIRNYYPEVNFLHHHPNLYKLIEKKGVPTIFHRWCCSIFKEAGGAGDVVLTGIRKEESNKRSKYEEVNIRSKRKEHQNKKNYTIQDLEETAHTCIQGKDKIMLYPILDWTLTDIWVYITKNHLPLNPCYEKGGRVGCMFCPFASKEQIEYYEKTQPAFHRLILASLDKYLHTNGRFREHKLTDTDDYWNWWKSKKRLNEYLLKNNQLSLNL